MIYKTMFSLETPIENLPKIGPSYLKRLHKLKLKTVRDLLLYFPYRYNDFSQITPIDQLKINQTATVSAEVVVVKNIRTRYRKMTITQMLVKDKSGSLKITWFNQPYLAKNIKSGQQVNFSGKFSSKGMISPVYEIIGKKEFNETTHTGRLVPIYHETAGLSSRYLRYLIKPILPLADQLKDWLPEPIKKENNLIDIGLAIKQVHFPKKESYFQKARQRLAFDEFFLIQLIILNQKQKLKKSQAPAIPFNQKVIKDFVQKLPFKLTDDQRLTTWEIFQDLQRNYPMNRLLDGDVGSGKTIVATMAALATISAGYQVALMAPTEILAKQHFKNISSILKKNKLKIGLLTSSDQSLTGRKEITKLKLKNLISQGKINLVIGTHALIEKNLFFKKLGLAIIDEQHRFGTGQRAKLVKCSNLDKLTPHLLSMSATPIPRTLSLTVYGDLDISVIKTLPTGQRQVETKIIYPDQRAQTYDFIRQELKAKKQAFVVCPLIEDSQKLEVKSVTQEYKKLAQQIFPEFRVALLHGKLKPAQKEKAISDFKKGQINILVSTSVIEVGVDIPQASIMIIEGADRFGLAQLHQFRGRIGRSGQKAYLFLLTESAEEKASQRLKALIDSQDGFQLAEKDLELRGPGNISGTRQWGLPHLFFASFADLDLIKKTRRAVNRVFAEKLTTPLLQDRLKSFKDQIHLE